ncbi:MAG: GIY-YIG nuclease family protein [Gammaproteobacteria bacterium]|nr:GIY-YIG nuclease family protein [Gammaproteobacteria bacterium]
MAKEKVKNEWQVYIILCSDNTLYTGITTDVEKRFAQHKNKKGAKYFYGRSPEKIVYVERGYNRSEASKREYEIKQLSRKKKLSLIDGYVYECDKKLLQ